MEIKIEYDEGAVVEFTVSCPNYSFIGAPLTGDWNMILHDKMQDRETILMHLFNEVLVDYPSEMRSVVSAALAEVRITNEFYW